MQTGRARRDRIRITLLVESLIGRSKGENRILQVCHFTIECPPFVRKEAKGEQRDRLVQLLCLRILHDNIEIVLPLRRDLL